MADLVILNARLVATMDDQRRELPGGWVSVTGGLIDGNALVLKNLVSENRIVLTDTKTHLYIVLTICNTIVAALHQFSSPCYLNI